MTHPAQWTREQKEQHPERYCIARSCLWNTERSGPCPSHECKICGTEFVSGKHRRAKGRWNVCVYCATESEMEIEQNTEEWNNAGAVLESERGT